MVGKKRGGSNEQLAAAGQGESGEGEDEKWGKENTANELDRGLETDGAQRKEDISLPNSRLSSIPITCSTPDQDLKWCKTNDCQWSRSIHSPAEWKGEDQSLLRGLLVCIYIYVKAQKSAAKCFHEHEKWRTRMQIWKAQGAWIEKI